MKPNTNFFFNLFAPALLLVLLMSFTLAVKELPAGDKASTTSEVTMNDAKDHCCCPPGWTLSNYQLGGRAETADRNGDGLICSKGFYQTDHPSNGTPNGQGNSPNNPVPTNVKDNNTPCDEGEFNPCAAP